MQLVKNKIAFSIKIATILLLSFLLIWFYFNKDRVFIQQENIKNLKQLDIYVDQSLFNITVKKMQKCISDISNNYKIYIKKINKKDLLENSIVYDRSNYVIITPFYDLIKKYSSVNNLNDKLSLLTTGEIILSTHYDSSEKYASIDEFFSDILNKNTKNIVLIDDEQIEAMQFFLNHLQSKVDLNGVNISNNREEYFDFLLNINIVNKKKQSNLKNIVYKNNYLEYYGSCSSDNDCEKIKQCLEVDL